MSDAIEFEYGIRRLAEPLHWEPHRAGMTIHEGTKWLEEWIEMGGDPHAFEVVRREIGPWERP